MGRKPSCDCGECKKCKGRAYQKRWWDSLSPERRREIVASRDTEKARRADRARYERDKPKRREAMDAYARANPDRVGAIKKAWIERNPEKRKAHSKVAYALRIGKLVRQPCEVCGAVKVHAHHDDYSKPLEVRWLCSQCHADLRRL